MNLLHLNITQDLGHGLMIIFMCCVLTATVVVIDLITGVRAAKKVGEPIRSHILRKTIDYFLVCAFCHFIRCRNQHLNAI